MNKKFTNLDDLWCEWPSATTAIMSHIKVNEPIGFHGNWNFREGQILYSHNEGYSLLITHTIFDPKAKSIVRLEVQAIVPTGEEITVRTNKREKI